MVYTRMKCIQNGVVLVACHRCSNRVSARHAELPHVAHTESTRPLPTASWQGAQYSRVEAIAVFQTCHKATWRRRRGPSSGSSDHGACS
jgi:hypothetical protein